MEDAYAVGTGNYLADAKLSRIFQIEKREDLMGWDTVHGELITFEDPEEHLPAIDGLEGFRPGGESFYTRVLVLVRLADGGETVLAWAYSVEEGSGVHLPGGSWPVFKSF